MTHAKKKVPKEEVVNVRCTSAQKTALEAAAAKEGMGLSTWLLRLGLVEERTQQEKNAR